jgi:hypothetical protein
MIRDEVEITLDMPRYGTAKELDPEFEGEETGDGGQRTEDGGPKTEDGRQKTEDGRPKTEVEDPPVGGDGIPRSGNGRSVAPSQSRSLAPSH